VLLARPLSTILGSLLVSPFILSFLPFNKCQWKRHLWDRVDPFTVRQG
jgi:hypothetical protein